MGIYNFDVADAVERYQTLENKRRYHNGEPAKYKRTVPRNVALSRDARCLNGKTYHRIRNEDRRTESESEEVDEALQCLKDTGLIEDKESDSDSDREDWVVVTDDEENYPDLYVTKDEVIEHFVIHALKLFYVSEVSFSRCTYIGQSHKIHLKVKMSFLDLLCFFMFYFVAKRRLKRLTNQLEEFSKCEFTLSVKNWFTDTFETDYTKGCDWKKIKNPEDVMRVLPVESSTDRELRQLEASNEMEMSA